MKFTLAILIPMLALTVLGATLDTYPAWRSTSTALGVVLIFSAPFAAGAIVLYWAVRVIRYAARGRS